MNYRLHGRAIIYQTCSFACGSNVIGDSDALCACGYCSTCAAFLYHTTYAVGVLFAGGRAVLPVQLWAVFPRTARKNCSAAGRDRAWGGHRAARANLGDEEVGVAGLWALRGGRIGAPAPSNK